MSSFREEAAKQKHVVGIHNDLATLFQELRQMLRGAPSNALLVGLLQDAAPHRMKTNVWARLRGQQEQLTIQARTVLLSVIPCCLSLAWFVLCFMLQIKQLPMRRKCINSKVACLCCMLVAHCQWTCTNMRMCVQYDFNLHVHEVQNFSLPCLLQQQLHFSSRC